MGCATGNQQPWVEVPNRGGLARRNNEIRKERQKIKAIDDSFVFCCFAHPRSSFTCVPQSCTCSRHGSRRLPLAPARESSCPERRGKWHSRSPDRIGSTNTGSRCLSRETIMAITCASGVTLETLIFLTLSSNTAAASLGRKVQIASSLKNAQHLTT